MPLTAEEATQQIKVIQQQFHPKQFLNYFFFSLFLGSDGNYPGRTEHNRK